MDMKRKKSFFIWTIIILGAMLSPLNINASAVSPEYTEIGGGVIMLDISGVTAGAWFGYDIDTTDAGIIISIKGPGPITFDISGDRENCRIQIEENAGEVDVVLNSLSLKCDNFPQDVFIDSGNTVTLYLAGSSSIVNGITVSETSMLYIEGGDEDTLICGAKTGGAGIGGGSRDGAYGAGVSEPSGAITINGGQITVTGSGGGAGIGGCLYGDSGTITINGGIIVASGGDDTGLGAGIGSGQDGNVNTIKISGGVVYAYGGYDTYSAAAQPEPRAPGLGASGIGAGHGGEGGDVIISGETTFVSAEGGGTGYDIGSNSISGGRLRIQDGAHVILNMNGTNACIFEEDGALSLIDGLIEDTGTGRMNASFENAQVMSFITLAVDRTTVRAGQKITFTASLAVEIVYIDEYGNEARLLPMGTVSVMVNGMPIISNVSGSYGNSFEFVWTPAVAGVYDVRVFYVEADGDVFGVSVDDSDSISVQVNPSGVFPGSYIPVPQIPPEDYPPEETESCIQYVFIIQLENRIIRLKAYKSMIYIEIYYIYEIRYSEDSVS